MPRRDVISREYKVMLRPSKFAGDPKGVVKHARAFWRDFAKVITSVVETQGDLATIKDRRLIRFYDTRKNRLNAGRYIFRERCCVETEEREVTLKFRHSDRHIAQDRRMDAKDGDDPRTKFEEDIKAPFVSMYSFSTTARIGKGKNLNLLKDVSEMFPDIVERMDDFPKDEKLVVVRNFTAHEIVIEGAEIRLKKDPEVRAECALIVWYNDGGARTKPVAAEFSFKYGNPKEDYDGRASQRAYDVFDRLQKKLGRWIDPKSQTKTAFVYG
jgi:hypothetical protein